MEPKHSARRMVGRTAPRHHRPAEYRHLLSVFLLATAIAVTACDQGTDTVDDGDEDEPSPELPAVVRVGSQGVLRIAFAPGDSVIAYYSGVNGRWAIPTDSLSVEGGGIQVESGPSRFDDFGLAIALTPLVRIAGSHFTAGTWFLNAGPRRVTVDVIPDAGGGSGWPGVALHYFENGLPSGDTTLVWNDLCAPGAGAPEWIALASFGYRMLDLVLQHHALALRDVAAAVDLDAALVRAGATGVSADGAPYPGTGERGVMTCRWQDANSSGALDPLDHFSYSRHHWWVAGPGPDRGHVLSGDWRLEKYFENRDPLIAVGGELVFATLQWSPARRNDIEGWSLDTPGVFVVGSGAVYIQELR